MRKRHNKENSRNCQNTERPPQAKQFKPDEETEDYQQAKEHDKCPPNQTKEKRNLPDKEFQIMIGKMIQNLEIKMESQISSLEKMQENFHKELEDIKKSQYIMNNAINEIRNTLEVTNSRI